MLVPARLLQGVAAALLTPNVLSLIGVLYTGPDRVRALSLTARSWGSPRSGDS